MIDPSTLDASTGLPFLGRDADEPPSLALVIAWSAFAPARLGEALIVPDDAKEPRVFGRASSADDEPDRVCFVRQRPGLNKRAAPYDDPFLSRRQVTIKGGGGHALVVENLGKRPMLVDGQEAREATIAPGATFEIKNRLVCLCVRRPSTFASLQSTSITKGHPYGEADAHGIVGESPAAWALRDQLTFVARRDAHALLLGESGSGKELVARAIHVLSPRGAKKLVSRNAATFPSGLIDAELFGTAANYPNAGMPERPGLVGEADGATLFLDEIGELPSELQAHLLRVLDPGGEYQRLGDAKRRTADVRLVAATNRAVADLKHDLAARLPLRIVVPGLNDRREDIALLARHLLRRLGARDAEVGKRFFEEGTEPRIAPALAAALAMHTYATHVRELDALLWESLTTSPGGVAELTDELREEMAETAHARAEGASEAGGITAATVRAALAKHGGVREKVWRELGLPNRYVLKRLLKKLGIDDDD